MIGDTTTTMMWLDGVAAVDVFHAYVASVAAFLVFAVPASLQQQRHSPIIKETAGRVPLDWPRIGVVALILGAAAVTNLTVNLQFPAARRPFPFIGVAVAAMILLTSLIRRPDWHILPESIRGSVFLLSLVLAASMMPVERLPAASWQTALGLGFLSSVFDNIPLTKLALDAGGYDWGFLAYAVGFGGSMIWFGSSAGVALSNRFPQARSVGSLAASAAGTWRSATSSGFFVLLATLGWQPHAPHH